MVRSTGELWAWALLVAAGCGASRHTVPAVDGGAECPAPPPGSVDLLLVMPNAYNHSDEQIHFAEGFALLLDVLSSGDVDGDGVADARPISDLQVGVITSDLGDLWGEPVVSCASAAGGDDGRLVSDTDPTLVGCPDELPRFLSAVSGVDDMDAFVHDIACLVRCGDDGCYPLQPLEAMLKALTPSTSALRFADGTVGHGDGYNAGFLREESRLAVLVMTKADDCSASSSWARDSWATICYEHAEHLHPVERYVDGLRALRPGPCNRPLFLALAGVPYDIQDESYDAMLADWRMMPEGDDPHSCDRPLARAPLRLVEVARGLEPAARVASICTPEFEPAMRRFGAEILGVLFPVP